MQRKSSGMQGAWLAQAHHQLHAVNQGPLTIVSVLQHGQGIIIGPAKLQGSTLHKDVM